MSHDDVCLIPYTSGTTGPSKGVMLTHGNVTWNVINWLTRADFRDDDVTTRRHPLLPHRGYRGERPARPVHGGTVVIPEAMEPDSCFASMERHRATVGFANPDLVEALTSSSLWSTTDLSTMRFIVTGGAPVPERLIRACLQRGLNLVQGYGLSEAGTARPGPRSRERPSEGGVAAGKPALFVDIRIVHADGLDALPGGDRRAPRAWPERDGRLPGTGRRPRGPPSTRTGGSTRAMRSRLDEDGDVWIVDRLQAGFLVGGRIVYPGDVERVLLDHPAIADAAVAGAPAPNGDTVVAAYVVLARGATATEVEIQRPAPSDCLRTWSLGL